MNKWTKIAIFSGLAGFLCWGLIFLTDSAYPDMIFRIFMPLGLFLVFLSIPLFLLAWILTIRKELTEKNYLLAGISILTFLIWLLLALHRFL